MQQSAAAKGALMSVGKHSPAPLSRFHSGSVCKWYRYGLLLCANSGISTSSREEASLPKRPGSETIKKEKVLLALQSSVVTSVLEAGSLRKKITARIKCRYHHRGMCLQGFQRNLILGENSTWGCAMQGPASFRALLGRAIGIKQDSFLAEDEQESRLWCSLSHTSVRIARDVQGKKCCSGRLLCHHVTKWSQVEHTELTAMINSEWGWCTSISHTRSKE